MTTISIALPDQLVEKLTQLAETENQSIDELIQTSSEDWIRRQKKFVAATDQILEERAELFQRLADYELTEQRRQFRSILVSAGLSKPASLDWPGKPQMSDEERLQLARTFQNGQSLSDMIREEREGI